MTRPGGKEGRKEGRCFASREGKGGCAREKKLGLGRERERERERERGGGGGGGERAVVVVGRGVCEGGGGGRGLKAMSVVVSQCMDLMNRMRFIGIIIIMIIIIIIIIIIIVIIAFKGAISSLRREPSPTRTLKWPVRNRVQITCNTSSAYHVQVSCYVPLGTNGQLSY